MSPPVPELRALERQRRLSAAAAPVLHWAVDRFLTRRLGYSMSGLDDFRREVWTALAGHRGPLIIAANHLTLIDSFLVYWAVFPWRRSLGSRWVPWSTPELRNYYYLGGRLLRLLVRGLLYICRCIPFVREGDDEASVRRRSAVFAKCAWLLRRGESVFVYPEAGRSRRGWLERDRPKDFLGRLALEVPEAKFLCVYLRGESQLCTTAWPARGETFRAYAALIEGARPDENSPRQVSQRLFDSLAALQDRWFAASRLAKNCGGNDVVDLRSGASRDRLVADDGAWAPDEEWLERHLTARESGELARAAEPLRSFWRMMAAKEAAAKALAQSGITTPSGGWRMLEADVFRRRVTHLPTGAQAEIAFTDDDAEKIHCLAVLRGGILGADPASGDVLWGVDEIPPGADASDYARERCLSLMASSNDEIGRPSRLAFADGGGIPKVLFRGEAQDWGVSLSHSGRFAAYSFMAS